MTNYIPRLIAAVLAVVFLSIPSSAQPNQAAEFTGEVHSATEALLQGYVVALEELATHRAVGHADVQMDGTFRFRNVPYGDYMLKVQTLFGEVLQQTVVNVGERSNNPSILLTSPKAPRPPSGGVSAARLMHPPAKKAFQSFVSAQKFSESGRFADAARELERAIEISPDYADAYSNLAVQYLRLGRSEESLSTSMRAVEIGKPNVVDLSNMAVALIALHRMGDAIRMAREALRFEPGNANANYILGSLLAADRRTLREGIAHLEKADSVPAARKNLERARAALAQGPTQ